MNDEARSESRRLEAIAADSWYAKGVSAELVRYSGRIFGRHWSGKRCLELGPAEGLMTEVLTERFPQVTLVDGSEKFCGDLRGRYPSAQVMDAQIEATWNAQTIEAFMKLGERYPDIAADIYVIATPRI